MCLYLQKGSAVDTGHGNGTEHWLSDSRHCLFGKRKTSKLIWVLFCSFVFWPTLVNSLHPRVYPGLHVLSLLNYIAYDISPTSFSSHSWYFETVYLVLFLRYNCHIQIVQIEMSLVEVLDTRCLSVHCEFHS